MKGFKITIIGWYIILLTIVLCSLLVFTGCRSTSSIERDTESHRVSQVADRMDSLISSTAMWQQDFYARQSSLIDSIREKEKSNSTHSVVVNEKGDTVRERIVIERIIEKEHSTESRESETVMHMQRQIDSLLHVVTQSNAVTDSLLKVHDKETVIVKEPTLWEKVKSSVGGFAIVFSLIMLIILVIKMLDFLRKRPLS